MADQPAPRPDAAAEPSAAASAPADESTAAATAAEPRPEEGQEPEVAAAAAELQAQVAEIEDRWRRALADLDNLRKRVARDVDRQRLEERGRVVAEWLPVLDNLDLALQHAEDDPSSIVEGVRAVRDQALSVLSRLGYPRRDDLGAVFDPSRHEAVSTAASSDAPEGTVVQVVRPGYGDDERTLRPASVVVATKAQ
jgi:molecular chaperone GrpE